MTFIDLSHPGRYNGDEAATGLKVKPGKGACDAETATQLRGRGCYHITHRCHKREFLFRFARHRPLYVDTLRETVRRFKIDILNYTVTSNHTHLLLWALRTRKELAPPSGRKLERTFSTGCTRGVGDRHFVLNKYAYNDRSEVIGGEKFQGTDINDIWVGGDPFKQA